MEIQSKNTTIYTVKVFGAQEISFHANSALPVMTYWGL